MKKVTVIVAGPSLDGVVSAVLCARAAEGAFEILLFESEKLGEFFALEVQQKLPPYYELMICGLEVTYRDWDGRLVRPLLMARLRSLTTPVKWFSARSWDAQDRAAVGHIIGERNLVVSESAPCTADLVKRIHFGDEGAYEQSLVNLVAGQLDQQQEQLWGEKWRKVISALRNDAGQLAECISPLIDGRPENIDSALAKTGEDIDSENRRFAREHARSVERMRERTLVSLSLPPEKHAFWAEISSYARAEAGADFSLCDLVGRPVLVLSQERECRVDLRKWSRYVTDLLPEAQAVVTGSDVVPLFVEGLDKDPGMRQQVIELLRDGAHLLLG